jgi:pyruvyl transferase EpsO
VVWLARSDKERRDGAAPEAPKDVLKTDWLVDDRTGVTLLNRRLNLLVRRFPALRGLWAPLSRTFRPLARERMSRGARILGQGRVVITNRLHGHILSMLLGIPHVVLDNRYGKVRGFFDTWTHASPLVEWADDEGRALERAREMAAAVRS